MITSKDPKTTFLKDLKKEMYFTENRLTTLEEMKALALALLATTWEITTYGYLGSTKEVNLLDRRWRFELNTRKRSAGLCNYANKTIYLSEWLLKQNLDKSLEFENTLRHEIAHALDRELGGRNHHNHVWKNIARQVLCTAERCFSSDVIQTKVTTKYTLICVNCDMKIAKHKRTTRKTACGVCCDAYNGGRYTEKFLLRQVQNY